MNRIPKALDTTDAYELFEKLRAAVENHPEYRDEVTRRWSVFEIQAIEESCLLEKAAITLIEKRQTTEVREMLTVFVQKKYDEAMATCEKILEFLNNLPVLDKVAKTIS